MSETKRERIFYALAEAAATGEPFQCADLSLPVVVCSNCAGTGLQSTTRKMRSKKQWLAAVKLGVTICRTCSGYGSRELRKRYR